ncbi:MAG: hypothetical protein AAF441_01645 [Pseudomonadota bacterium]
MKIHRRLGLGDRLTEASTSIRELSASELDIISGGEGGGNTGGGSGGEGGGGTGGGGGEG